MNAEQPQHELRPARPTWTHLALHVNDIDKVTTWYEEFTHLCLLFREEDEDGYSAWLGDEDQSDSPIILVLGQFFPGHDPFAPPGAPAAGPVCARSASRSRINESSMRPPPRAKEAGCLILGPQQMPKRIGYICFLRDPEGNIVEFSYDQGVYEKAREVWGNNVNTTASQQGRIIMAKFKNGVYRSVKVSIAAGCDLGDDCAGPTRAGANVPGRDRGDCAQARGGAPGSAYRGVGIVRGGLR